MTIPASSFRACSMSCAFAALAGAASTRVLTKIKGGELHAHGDKRPPCCDRIRAVGIGKIAPGPFEVRLWPTASIGSHSLPSPVDETSERIRSNTRLRQRVEQEQNIW